MNTAIETLSSAPSGLFDTGPTGIIAKAEFATKLQKFCMDVGRLAGERPAIRCYTYGHGIRYITCDIHGSTATVYLTLMANGHVELPDLTLPQWRKNGGYTECEFCVASDLDALRFIAMLATSIGASFNAARPAKPTF
ncbi:hypothetical protein FM996_21905 [Methylosinus sporium]|uniref:Uncharacterized protein n=1 Tax=Methylosinus sporium TaxID=428 RepID=A0A549SCB9_METSR|nr:MULTISPECIES: hypothetical protein [Methylosinus]MBU3891056.1 hypothetical protein [Methylosinus sp. KRF6]TRL20381.1 hypothetical protein FM996_21905 [Methylosinus sporium]